MSIVLSFVSWVLFQTLIWCLLCDRHRWQHFACINQFNSHNIKYQFILNTSILLISQVKRQKHRRLRNLLEPHSLPFSSIFPGGVGGASSHHRSSCCSVTKSCLTLWHHGLQHARLSCPLSPGVCSDSCPLSWWCCLTISSSATPFSFCFQSFPASGSFLMSQLFASGGHWSFNFSVSPSSEYSGLISFRIDSLCSPRVFSSSD